MEKYSDTSYYKAVVVERPKNKPYGLLTVQVRLRNKQLTANFLNSDIQAVNLKSGDEIWICPATGDIGPIVKHNPLMRFLKLLWN